ncbi:hypothetical protein MNB_SV-14-1259 [hydrothermal vent metagenome]|uniref:SPOR domain-containing protein n=1 Tax=hydrothermal vent metagenome TaxID=652676 RepID=A0A1W1CMX3_9ZZZZ
MRFLLLFVSLAFHYLQASYLNIHMPQQTKSQLCQKLSDHECTNEEQLQYKNYFKLNNDRLLLFFNTYSKNALYPNGSLNVPVTVDINGKWQVINSYISDEIQAIEHDPHDGIWLHTMSTRKHGYSSLYYSRDAKQWQKIKLPSVRTFQTLQLCFQDNDVILTFQRVENDNVKAWVTSYNDALSPEPTWRLMEKKELYQKVCQKTSAYNNGWILKSNKNSTNVLFKHKYKNITISFPKKSFFIKQNIVFQTRDIPSFSEPIIKAPRITKLAPKQQGIYSIQLGTFNYKTSLPLVYQEFSRLKNGLVTKEVPTADHIQYKVFLETFRDIHEAKIRLGELRSEYPNSKIIKGAFVTKLP